MKATKQKSDAGVRRLDCEVRAEDNLKTICQKMLIKDFLKMELAVHQQTMSKLCIKERQTIQRIMRCHGFETFVLIGVEGKK